MKRLAIIGGLLLIGAGCTVSGPRPVSIGTPERPPSASVMAPKGGILITGRVTDAVTGEGLPNMSIVVSRSSYARGAVTDGEGRYALPVPSEAPDEIRVYVAHGANWHKGSEERLVDTRAGDTVVDFVLDWKPPSGPHEVQPVTGTIAESSGDGATVFTGLVYDSVTLAPIEGIRVAFVGGNAPIVGGNVAAQTLTMTDAAGAFRIPLTGGGVQRVQFVKDGKTYREEEIAFQIVFRDGYVTRMDIPLAPR